MSHSSWPGKMRKYLNFHWHSHTLFFFILNTATCNFQCAKPRTQTFPVCTFISICMIHQVSLIFFPFDVVSTLFELILSIQHPELYCGSKRGSLSSETTWFTVYCCSATAVKQGCGAWLPLSKIRYVYLSVYLSSVFNCIKTKSVPFRWKVAQSRIDTHCVLDEVQLSH